MTLSGCAFFIQPQFPLLCIVAQPAGVIVQLPLVPCSHELAKQKVLSVHQNVLLGQCLTFMSLLGSVGEASGISVHTRKKRVTCTTGRDMTRT